MERRRSNSTKGAAQPAEHLEEEDGHDELLGSRLEIELNRSIEKMREEEKAFPGCHGRSEDFVNSYNNGSVTSGSQNDAEELLEDIEMPTMNLSQWENSDLISVSSVSPISPIKARGSSKIEISSSSSFVAAENTINVREEVSDKHMTRQTVQQIASSPDMTEEKIPREMNVYEKLAFLSAPSAACVKTLVSIDEANTDKNVLQNKSYSCDASRKESSESELDLGDEAANTTPQASLPDLQVTLGTGLELLDIENMNDSLLISSFLERFSNKVKNTGIIPVAPSQILETESDPVKVKTAVEDDESFSSVFFSDAFDIVTELETRAASMPSPDRRATLHPLDMDAINDSLLNSFSLANSPAQKELHGAFISSLPSIMEKFGKKTEITSDETVKPNNCSFDGLVKVLKDTLRKECILSVKPKIKVKNNLEDTFSINEKNKGMNLTFDHQNIRPILNSTFEKQLEDPASVPSDRKDANATFVQNSQGINRTFECESSEDTNPSKFLNVTFEKKDQAAACENDNLESDGKEKDKLNVTFERGEYKIASMNETVNLMDAETDVLQIILDATPHKVSKRAPDAASTPKSSNTPSYPAAKRMITKDPTQTFLRRISLGMRRDITSKKCEDDSQHSSQTINTLPVIPGLKMGSMDQQAVANQLRRLHSGMSSLRSGPVRALPGLSLTMAHKLKDSGNTHEGLEDGGGGSENHVVGVNDGGSFIRREGPAPASFGSVSSIESERPGTPDLGIITGIGMSTPEVFRREGPSSGPRITSTPAMGGAVFPCVLGIEGPAPTPISAPSSRLRSNTVVSTASLPEGHNGGTPSWQGLSQDSSKDSKTTAKLPGESTSSSSKQCPSSETHSQENLGSDKSKEQEGVHFDNSVQNIPNEEAKNMLPETSDNDKAESHIQSTNVSGNLKLTAAELTVGGKTDDTQMDIKPDKVLSITNVDHHQVNDAAAGEMPLVKIGNNEVVLVESSLGRNSVVDIDATESQTLKDTDAEYQQDDNTRNSCRSKNKTPVGIKLRSNATNPHKSAAKRGIISEISKQTKDCNNSKEKPNLAHSRSSLRVIQDKTKFAINKTRSPQVIAHNVSAVSAKGALDKKRENSLKSEKTKSVGMLLKRNAAESRPIRANKTLNKDDKENKRESIDSSRQSTSQLKAGAHASRGRKVPSLRPFLGHSNIAGKRSLSSQPSVLKNIPIKPNPKPLKAESLQFPRPVEAKKFKSPSPDSKPSPPLSAVKETTVAKGLRTPSTVTAKGIPKSKIVTGIKIPVDVNHGSLTNSCSALKPKNQGYSAGDFHAKSKLPRNANTNSTAPRKLSMLKVQKNCVL
nr:uncharacterized protein LOC123752167 isoform X1 [Procambarus clarkii]